MRRLTVVVAVGALAVLLRGRLVDLLTRTTGTWVGSPPSAVRPPVPATA